MKIKIVLTTGKEIELTEEEFEELKTKEKVVYVPMQKPWNWEYPFTIPYRTGYPYYNPYVTTGANTNINGTSGTVVMESDAVSWESVKEIMDW